MKDEWIQNTLDRIKTREWAGELKYEVFRGACACKQLGWSAEETFRDSIDNLGDMPAGLKTIISYWIMQAYLEMGGKDA